MIESLEHIGQLTDIRVHPVVPSEKVFGYRNKMEFSFSDRRWLLTEELSTKDIPKDFALGLHAPGRHEDLAPRIRPRPTTGVPESVHAQSPAAPGHPARERSSARTGTRDRSRGRHQKTRTWSSLMGRRRPMTSNR